LECEAPAPLLKFWPRAYESTAKGPTDARVTSASSIPKFQKLLFFR
jgi:hypothetical protein